MLTVKSWGGRSIENPDYENTFLNTIEELNYLYQGFPLESEIWARDGHRRSPYRALILFGLSPRTKDRLLVEMCCSFFEEFPDLNGFLEAGPPQWESLQRIVRAGQFPFIESAIEVLQKNSRKVPKDAPTLARIKGVGAKVTECVIGYGWGQEALPVDANVCRVVSRLGGLRWDKSSSLPTHVREHLKGMFHRHRGPLADQHISMIDIHELLRLHGQVICTRTPRCWQCPLAHCGARQSPMTASTKPEVSSNLWDDWRRLLLDPTCGNIRGNQSVKPIMRRNV